MVWPCACCLSAGAGWGNSLQVGGYKVGMLVSGSGLLLAMDTLGWHLSLGSGSGAAGADERADLAFCRKAPATVPAGAGRAGWSRIGCCGIIAACCCSPACSFGWRVLLSFKLGDALGLTDD